MFTNQICGASTTDFTVLKNVYLSMLKKCYFKKALQDCKKMLQELSHLSDCSTCIFIAYSILGMYSCHVYFVHIDYCYSYEKPLTNQIAETENCNYSQLKVD